jgi:hypothetical protein
MSKDISPMLDGWPHEPGKVSVRKVRGDDGSVKIQLRVDLGVLQMQSEGRPDGVRPHGCDSLFDYHRQQVERLARSGEGSEGYHLDEQQCELLRAEATQYYYRYLSEFVLEEYEAVARDTSRNLKLLDFMAEHAQDEADRMVMEQYRPYILMMNARAKAQMTLADNRPRLARTYVRQALVRLKRFYDRFGSSEMYRGSAEVLALEALLREIEARIPVDPMARLKRQLEQAVREERYEEAARLRDVMDKVQKRRHVSRTENQGQ